MEYYNPSNSTLNPSVNGFDFGSNLYSELPYETYQDHVKYSGKEFNVGMKDVFERCNDYSQEPVGEVFFSEKNIKRLQKQIKDEIYEKSNHRYISEEDQEIADLLAAMRAVYQLHGKFINTHLVHQVKDLNKKLVAFVVPDMLTQIKQYYGYLKDVNEPLKPIDRPMNVSSAGRKTLPSISTLWTI